jgi:hypothetical protein
MFLMLLILLVMIEANRARVTKFLTQNEEREEVRNGGKKIMHIIAHSHQDAGWGRTAIQYYNGAVDGILANVTKYLLANPEKHFSHAEIWFF